jgi:hypothetical protein
MAVAFVIISAVGGAQCRASATGGPIKMAYKYPVMDAD